ncbi:hypothetical protein J2W30_005227 [Variovorax boronicumulans]|uniref:hypothetical protein n=1 Tax=Variovorax TaxID=34072 RepID=UPI002780C1F6|nr:MULTISPECIES: hypothetical protein [Variovorax]MDQ0037451.1 hypothetical protein [Variovorax boronicumulans]MDQ0607137.1 hypothetical protein [Variovorax sp. W1I1]
MSSLPVFTEDCLDTSSARANRRETLDILNTRLHPALQKILAAEIASGNRVVDVGIDWPDAGSVHVTLHNHFDNRHTNAEAVFSLCDDPHYWHADYSTTSKPTHLLIC